MTSKRTDELLDISRQAEDRYLARTLEIIHNNIESYGKEVSRLRSQIDDMLEHFHDDNPELINTLENTITMHDSLHRALDRNERAVKKPYFGRLLFHDETYHKEESLYIGKGGIAENATTPAVIDWRAPVANAYYENGLGKCSYPAPDGKQILIDLKLKRTYEIENGHLLNYFDSEVISNDDLLTKYLAQNKQAVLGDIVATIQQEQNAIIRKSPYHNIIVQGVAGSGKTTVAMHRISYILYNYADRFRPDDFYIVGSNRILLNYITSVLPSLDVYGVRQMTMEQLFVRLLYEDWDEKKYTIKPMDQTDPKSSIKGRLSWFKALRTYCSRLEQETIYRESIYLNPHQFVEGLRDGKSGVYDESAQHPASPEDLILLMDGDAVERYIRQNPTVSLQSKINMLNERLITKIKDEFLGKGVKYTEPEKKAILKAYRGRYGSNVWKKSIFDIYRDFLSSRQTYSSQTYLSSSGSVITYPTPDENGKIPFDVYDLAALAYIYKRIKETDEIREASHVVIDEAQDFGMMAYSVLKYCIKGCTYTIMGDVSQNIRFGYGLNDWEELRDLYLTDPMDSFGVLKKSYRNTVEISNFATHILHHGQFSIYPAEPIIRHGKPVVTKPCSDYSAMILTSADQCKKWQSEGLETIAIICRNQKQAFRAADQLKKHIQLMENDPETTVFGNGIMVLPVEYTKGLEFDAVIILDPTREEYPVNDGHAKLLYVAATRALHELQVLHTGDLTGLIADPVPKRQIPNMEKNSQAEQTAAQPHTANQKKASLPGTDVKQINTLHTNYTRTGPKPLQPTYSRPQEVSYAKHVSESRTDTTKSITSNTGISLSTRNISFGDMPATEKLSMPIRSRTDQAIRWVTKQSDGLYLQSRYGLLRLSPVTASIIRVTFTTSNRIIDGVHPLIRVNRTERMWMYRESPKLVELTTDELCLQIDKATGSIRYMNRDKKLLLAERSKESRLLFPPENAGSTPSSSAGATSRPLQGRLYLDWQKSENLYGINVAQSSNIPLKGGARYISHGDKNSEFPFLLSDKGYGILVASIKPAISCDIPTYGSFLSGEYSDQMDYYFIAGKNANTILSAYAYLCGKIFS